MVTGHAVAAEAIAAISAAAEAVSTHSHAPAVAGIVPGTRVSATLTATVMARKTHSAVAAVCAVSAAAIAAMAGVMMPGMMAPAMMTDAVAAAAMAGVLPAGVMPASPVAAAGRCRIGPAGDCQDCQ